LETKNEEMMNQNLKELHNQKKRKGKLEGRNAFFKINDNQPF